MQRRAPQPTRHRHASAAVPGRHRSGSSRHGTARPGRSLERRVRKGPRPPRYVFKPGRSRRRLLAVFVSAAIILTVVVARVALLQTTQADALRASGRDQRTSVRDLKATRGTIFDRNGAELAISVPSATVTANPKLVTDPAGTAATLASLLSLSDDKRQSLVQSFEAKDSSFVYVARQVGTALGQTVGALGLAGIDIVSEDQRVLPAGEVGRSVIGRTDPDGVGTAGLEDQYDGTLTGTNGERVRVRDRDGNTIPGAGATTIDPVPGNDMVLTIDRAVQFNVEQALLKRVIDLNAKGGNVIVEDTTTGEIVAMAGVQRNPAGEAVVTTGNIGAVDAYEPGSVAKVITLAGALNEGAVAPNTSFDVPYSKKFTKDPKDAALHDAEIHKTEQWSVEQILVHSSNIGTVEVSQQLGLEQQHAYMQAFGLGATSALDFPGESAGILRDWQQWQGNEKFTVAYGQGVASTSVQLIGAVNTIANNGVYVAPKLVKATIGADGTMVDTAASATHQVVTPQTAWEMNHIMRQVVCEGTATYAQVGGVTIAGKTGTGLKSQPNGTYADADGNRHYYSSFVGFFPAEAPKVTVLVSIDEPNAQTNFDERFGGTAAGPLFKDIVPSIMHQLDVQPPEEGGGCPAA